MKHLGLLAAVFSFLSILGCRTATLSSDGATQGNWQARALIKDLKEDKSYIVNLDLNLIRNQSVRMDVTSALGTGVASMTATETEVRYALYDSKQFFVGQPKANVMRPVLTVPFNPLWLHNILFDIPFADKGWSCAKDDQGLLSECKDMESGIKVAWKNRNGPLKNIVIEHERAVLQINVKKFRPKVEGDSDSFILEAPKGFKKLRVKQG